MEIFKEQCERIERLAPIFEENTNLSTEVANTLQLSIKVIDLMADEDLNSIEPSLLFDAFKANLDLNNRVISYLKTVGEYSHIELKKFNDMEAKLRSEGLLN